MASTNVGGSVQRYTLKTGDSVKINSSGTSPVLEIGSYQFSLPQDPTFLQHFAQDWQNCTTQIQQLMSSTKR